MTYAQMAARAKRAMQGAQNKAAGRYFEQIIGAACSYYRDNGIADIDKTPEPTKQLTGKNSKGQFTACYEKRAQPDFKGTLLGGKIVVLFSPNRRKASTDTRRWGRAASCLSGSA